MARPHLAKQSRLLYRALFQKAGLGERDVKIQLLACDWLPGIRRTQTYSLRYNGIEPVSACLRPRRQFTEIDLKE